MSHSQVARNALNSGYKVEGSESRKKAMALHKIELNLRHTSGFKKNPEQFFLSSSTQDSCYSGAFITLSRLHDGRGHRLVVEVGTESLSSQSESAP